MYTWSERCRSHARIFLRSGEDVNERWSMIKYWSNSDGDLHRYGKEDITEDQLPFMLKKAYNGAYLQVPGLYSYLVETSAGYGISYEMHLDEGYVRSLGLSMKEAFNAITNLLTVYRHKAGLRGCDIFLFEDTEWDGHEIVFVVPADVSKKRLKMISETVIKFEEELDKILKNMKEERKNV